MCAALADGLSELSGALVSDDTRVMVESLGKLGIGVEASDGGRTLQIHGCAGEIPNPAAELFVENSGTTIRFLTAALALAGGTYRLDGVPRMRERPIGPLVAALQKLGVQIEAESPGECPPVSIDSSGAHQRQTGIAGDVSSQYLSGLLMGAPLAVNGLQIAISQPCVSWPYVEMTCRVMEAFGVRVERDGQNEAEIAAGQKYVACHYAIEPDASAASYFWAVAALCGGTVRVAGLNRDSLQGDVRFVEALAAMGCQVDCQSNGISVTGPARLGIDIDMADFSDTAQTLAVVALFVEGPTRIRGIAHNRVKETDRVGNLAVELRKLGATVEEHEDGLVIHPPAAIDPATIDTYQDHRMAMSFALAGLKRSGIRILDPGCVAKTFPDYFQVLQQVVQNGSA
ncbi:MAG: 3-phosphoshikimate 1-carboxyvinyltransferase [Mariniblastus sp.]|nr:3-phosphoshikimate 1-carboxyvinyltransferase [Mariniblastus sp.]